MIYYVIDAFSEDKFGGNPAGVVIYENLTEDFMQKFAAEMRFSETAFVKNKGSKIFEIRYFTPVSEVDLCGHATVASFKALLDSGFVEDNGSYDINTKAGVLHVYIKNSFIMMEQAEPKIGERIENCDEIAEIFKIKKEEIGDLKYNLIPQSSSTGLWDMMLPLKSSEILDRLNPDFKKLSEFSERKGVCGVHAFTLDAHEGTAICRNFCPLYGINEEAATGTANGALAYYLYKNNILKDFEKDYVFLQGITMGRPSMVTARLADEESPRVLVGGKAVILTRGEIYL